MAFVLAQQAPRQREEGQEREAGAQGREGGAQACVSHVPAPAVGVAAVVLQG